ncbi:MAG TPA: PilZ domain-containing protein, partial [Planctomycetaceae bacterium]|nr:PilZ domain-containing protein [Planctomycetaceae bacterium]
MSQDPWSRPSLDDLRRVLESIGKPNVSNLRVHERLELSVPAEIRTGRGNTVA